MKNKKIVLIMAFLILQTIIFFWVAKEKSYLHIDEVYSLGLIHYDKIEIQDNDDFYNEWHTKDYFIEYLSVQESEQRDYTQVYENQKNDVHPPLYYLMLRFFMEFSINNVSILLGISLNIIIYILVTIFMYLILKELLKNEKHSTIKSIVLATASSLILASISTVINIRMYALSTLNIVIATYLHIKLFKSNSINYKLLFFIGLNALMGVLTHYYYIFYLFAMYCMFVFKYIKEKDFKQLLYYTLTLVIAGIISLIIFPYSIYHMFFGYRGEGVINNFKDISEFFESIIMQIDNVNYYVFNNFLPVILLIIIGLIIYIKKYKKSKVIINKDIKQILMLIYIPILFFFIVTSIASPWKVLRYFSPICGLLFVITMYYMYKLIQKGFNKKICNIIMPIMLVIILCSPIILKNNPELYYNDRKEIVQTLSTDLNVPAIYFFNIEGGTFLDDLYMFSQIEESYITKDNEYNKESIQKIVDNKDMSKGIVIFINGNQDNDYIISNVKNALNLQNDEYLQRLTACDVYYIY